MMALCWLYVVGVLATGRALHFETGGARLDFWDRIYCLAWPITIPATFIADLVERFL